MAAMTAVLIVARRTRAPADNPAMLWDVYCRIVDNHGDLGVCWRLAADLAARGEHVRLWVDDASALAWMAPQGARGVAVHDWPAEHGEPGVVPGDVVIAAFGCDLPDDVLGAMAAARPAPVWINLEYLSAEAYVQRSHGLPSLQSSGSAAGLTQWFFFPGYVESTGGLLREPGLAARQAAFDRDAWLASKGIEPRGHEALVSVFCYSRQPAFGALLETLGSTLLLAAPGAATDLMRACLGPGLVRGRLRGIALPWLSQLDYDYLLWAADVNFVRGEDSWVRAQWAGRPFVWQAYAQDDGAHRAKLEAFMDRYLAEAPAGAASALRNASLQWNGLRGGAMKLPPIDEWRMHAARWRDALACRPDLVTQMIGFVERRTTARR